MEELVTMNTYYKVKQLKSKNNIEIKVPGSKSITNRALMLSALSNGLCKLNEVLFSDDSRAFLECLIDLGFKVKINEDSKIVSIEVL